MCKIISINEYVRNQRLREDYLNEIIYYTNKFIANKQLYSKISTMYFCPFRGFILSRLNIRIENCKDCIMTFTQLYSECDIQIVKVV